METFDAELLGSIHDLDDRNAFCVPAPSTTRTNNDKTIDLDVAQGTNVREGGETKPKNSSLSVRLDALPNFRMRADSIYFTSSQPDVCGGKAEVFKAIWKRGNGSDEQQVAVKKLRYYDNTNERKFGNEFVQEVEVMARLSHENIVKLIGFVEELQEGNAWVVLSWEPNGNVSEFLTREEWEIPERLSLIKDTFAGLEYLHTRQPPICHGDLKSLNILVSASYRAIITDFGSARILKETDDSQENRGEAPAVIVDSAATKERVEETQITIVASLNQLTLTGPAWSLRWAAPEVVLGEPQSLESDIWAAGWICWEIMTNKVPFSELNSEGAITLQVVQGQVPSAREDTQLSQVIRLCSLMAECWIFDPSNRPKIARCNSEIKWMPSIPPSGEKPSDSKVLSTEILCQMGRIHISQGAFQQAIQLFQQVLSRTSASDQKTRATALLELGRTCYLMSKDTEAEQYLTRAQEIFARVGDDLGLANTLHWMAKMQRHQSKLALAEESYTQAGNIYSRIGDQHGLANILRGLGNTSYDHGQYPEAEQFYNQAREVYDLLGDDQGQANTLRRLGLLSHDRSEYMKSEEYFNQAFVIACRIGDNLGRANVMLNLGDLYHAQGLNTKAAASFAEARRVYAEIGDSNMETYCSLRLDGVSNQ